MQNIKLSFLMCCLWALSLGGLSAQPIDYVMECAVDTAIQSPSGGGQPAYHLYRPRTDQIPAFSCTFFTSGTVL
ncbi:MAG: hypothetical protein HUU01_09030 [Saprospiraceae bacterium]|nr:hypothetical protein [Saprospiraceae bacterium]